MYQGLDSSRRADIFNRYEQFEEFLVQRVLKPYKHGFRLSFRLVEGYKKLQLVAVGMTALYPVHHVRRDQDIVTYVVHYEADPVIARAINTQLSLQIGYHLPVPVLLL